MTNPEADDHSENRILIWWGMALALLGTAVSVFFYYLLRGGRKGESGAELKRKAVQPPQGLTEAEAAARYDPQTAADNSITSQPAYSRKKIAQETIFTIFNLNLVLLAAIQIVFIRPLDGLITLGVIVVNVVTNIFPYEVSRRRMKNLLNETRPQVTVMRDGQARSIHPQEIVPGDIIAAGVGDQIIADGPLVGEGELVVDETLLGSGRGNARKKAGDYLLAGSICLNGRAAYRAEVLGDQRQVIQYLRSIPQVGSEMTAVEKTLNRIMRTLLVIMIVLTGIFVVSALQADLVAPAAELFDPVVVILNLAPASLFFMIVLTYVSGTADLGNIGALVAQSRTVESIAQLDVLCFAKAGFLTGIGFKLQEVEQSQDEAAIALPRVRQILGDFAHSLSGSNPTMRALAQNFPGQRRRVIDQAPYFSAYGWNGIVFDDEDLHGLYVLAEAELMPLSQEKQPTGRDGAKEKGGLTQTLTGIVKNPIARFRGRRKKGGPEQEGRNNGNQHTAGMDGGNPVVSEAVDAADGEGGQGERKGRFGWRSVGSRLSKRISSLVRRKEGAEAQDAPEEPEAAQNILIFAANIRTRSLSAGQEGWRLPDDLRPLCRIVFEEKVKPEAREAINMLSRRGVAVKIFTADNPEQTAERLRAAGVDLVDDPRLSSIDRPELDHLQGEALGRAGLAHTVFGSLSPQKSAEIVKALRESGQAVGVAGDGVNDVAALRAADLAIVRKDSSPAALGLGDMILLDEAPDTLSRVMDKGQRIVNGLVDVLKLYLTQIFYLLSLIILIPLLARGFPYSSQQAGLIALVTLTIPAFALSLFAGSGKLPRASIGRILQNFAIPAGAAIAILGLYVYGVSLGSGNVDYAQNMLTYALIIMGLLLVLNIQPPFYASFQRGVGLGDLRPLLFVILAFITTYVIVNLPFLRDMFGTVPITNLDDYTLILRAAALWLVVVRIFWWLFPVVRREMRRPNS